MLGATVVGVSDPEASTGCGSWVVRAAATTCTPEVGVVGDWAPSGNRRVNVEPTPGSLQSVTSPPWLAATCLTMLSPRPVPPVARERAGSTR